MNGKSQAIARRWVTPGVQRVFEAEVTNERNGGISPSTLSSAIDSLMQMPDDILDDITEGTTRQTLLSLLIIRDLLPGTYPVTELMMEEPTRRAKEEGA